MNPFALPVDMDHNVTKMEAEIPVKKEIVVMLQARGVPGTMVVAVDMEKKVDGPGERHVYSALRSMSSIS